jgi:hypothetical protein
MTALLHGWMDQGGNLETSIYVLKKSRKTTKVDLDQLNYEKTNFIWYEEKKKLALIFDQK